eukprot:GHVP01035149.1.p1 GENE.GHVP01035149.1~~GHVP01035149.1.p1  ORF type:complete len:580 (-),score=86.27 GHVP01035149.1:1191-2930(-)
MFLEAERQKHHRRFSGIFLHVSSIPSNYGCGSFGHKAKEWIDILARNGQRVWQILPLGPSGGHGCPYMASASHGIDTAFIDLDVLVFDGLLKFEDIHHLICGGPREFWEDLDKFPRRVNWPVIRETRPAVLAKAYKNFILGSTPTILERKELFRKFCDFNSYWLVPFCVFHHLGEKYQAVEKPVGKWSLWDKDDRDAKIAIEKYKELPEVKQKMFEQYEAHRQLQAVKHYAHQHGVCMYGDLSFYVDFQSCDCWEFPHLFSIDLETMTPEFISGAPPDYFSEDGQLWGHPVFLWEKHFKDNFQWWSRRMKYTYEMFDIVRLDHFRAVYNYWSTPANALTAREGKWELSPGQALIDVFNEVILSLTTSPLISEELEDDIPKDKKETTIEAKSVKVKHTVAETLPFRIIAEDLGSDLPDELILLRRRNKIPSMRVLQFGISTEHQNQQFNDHAIFNITYDTVTYTATHDNATTEEWFDSLSWDEKNFATLLFGFTSVDKFYQSGVKPSEALVRVALGSASALCIIPISDVLNSSASCRYNDPSNPEGSETQQNWNWALADFEEVNEKMSLIARYTRIFGRS